MKEPKKGNRYLFPATEHCMQCGTFNLPEQSFCSPKCRVKYRYKIYWMMESKGFDFWEAVDIIETRKLIRIIKEETGGRIYRKHNGLPFTIRVENNNRQGSN